MSTHQRPLGAGCFLLSAMILTGCGLSGPSHSELEAAVNATVRKELQDQADSPLSQFNGQAEAIETALKAPGFSVGIADQKCNKIGDDKYRCDVLLDFSKANQVLIALKNKDSKKSGSDAKEQEGPFPPNQQDAFTVTKLGGEWRAEEIKEDR